jgi:Zn-dependent membrane protease YugP
VEVTPKGGDHYSIDEKAVRLSLAHFEGKSISAVAVAAHEVAHAIQDRDGYQPLLWRTRLIKKTIWIERIGSAILLATPLVFTLLRSPAILLLEITVAFGILASTIIIHLVTLPTEFDASFNKALPVLENYLPAEEMPAARTVLKAAAFTYVSGALLSLFNIGRWARIFRF